MNAVKFLESQHREVEGLFKRIDSLGDKAGKKKKDIFYEIQAKLEIHAKIEEKIFYPEGEEVDEDATLEALEEHEVVKSLLKKIAKTKASDKTLTAKLTVLKEVVEHHVEEEEKEYFPECQKKLGEEEMQLLGERLEAQTEKLEGQTTAKRKKR